MTTKEKTTVTFSYPGGILMLPVLIAFTLIVTVVACLALVVQALLGKLSLTY